MERLGRMDVNYSIRDIYNRQILLDNIGIEGQEKICRAKVLIVGAGGLGSPVIQYIAAAGVGNISIIDNDIVSAHNLQRQILYNWSQIGKSKAMLAKKYISTINPKINVTAYNSLFDKNNADKIVEDNDVIVDCCDNLATRYVIDTYSKKHKIPFVHGSLCEYEGRVSVFNYCGGSSYNDLYPYEKEAVENFVQPKGILGAFAGIVGSVQATETVKVLLNSKNTLSDKLLLIDGLNMEFRVLKIGK